MTSTLVTWEVYMYVGERYSVPNPGMTTHLCFDGYYDIFLCLQDIFYIKKYIFEIVGLFSTLLDILIRTVLYAENCVFGPRAFCFFTVFSALELFVFLLICLQTSQSLFWTQSNLCPQLIKKNLTILRKDSTIDRGGIRTHNPSSHRSTLYR